MFATRQTQRPNSINGLAAQGTVHPVTVERALAELRALNAELSQLDRRIAGLTGRFAQ